MKLTKRDKRTNIEKEIDDILLVMSDEDIDSDEYKHAITVLERLHKMKELDKTSKFKISPDTIVVVVGNLLGICLILNYEKIGVISSKAIGFVIRGRV